MKRFLLIGLLALLTVACQKPEEIQVSPEGYHAAIDHLTEVMIHDIFSPPVQPGVCVSQHSCF